MKKSLAQHWRDQFEGRGQTPIFWQAQARSLLAAGNVLRERLDNIGLGRMTAPPEVEDPPHLHLMPIYLLYGYALENLLKGLLVARGEAATWSGSLDKGLRHHRLTELARRGDLALAPHEESLLEDLREAIEAGKYPVGTRPQNRPRALGLDVSGDFRCIFAVCTRIERSLRQICLDGVLTPAELATLGLRSDEADSST